MRHPHLLILLLAAAASASSEQFVELATNNTYCSAATHTVLIKSEAQCRAASAKLKLVFARGFYGTGDFPGCLRANDGRNKVYWNRSPRPSSTPNRPLYSAICQSSSIRPVPTASQEQFVELAKLNTFCSAATHTVPIKSEAQCRAASAKLKLVFAKGWNGPGSFPGCMHCKDGRNTVYWNRSPRPSLKPNRPLYSAICQSSSIRPVPTGDADSDADGVKDSADGDDDYANDDYADDDDGDDYYADDDDDDDYADDDGFNNSQDKDEDHNRDGISNKRDSEDDGEGIKGGDKGDDGDDVENNEDVDNDGDGVADVDKKF